MKKKIKIKIGKEIPINNDNKKDNLCLHIILLYWNEKKTFTFTYILLCVLKTKLQ